MTTITTTPSASSRITRSLPAYTAATAVVGAAVTTAVAAVIHAAGASLKAGGAIPVGGVFVVTVVGGILGGVLLGVARRRPAAARTRFLQVTVALTVLSCAPPLALADSAGSAAALTALHLVAAACIIPVLARRAATR